MEFIGYLAAMLMGITLGLIGGGGSILTVPILVYLFNFSPSAATGQSLFVVGVTALVGSLTYIKKGEVSFSTGLAFAAPGFLGIYATRNHIVPNLPEIIFQEGSITISKELLIMAAFAGLMVLASYSMIKKSATLSPPPTAGAKRFLNIGIRGFFVGAITGFVGAGGGFLIIPALVIMAGLTMKVAVGTSLTIIAVNSLLGFATSLQHQGQIAWNLLLVFSGLAILGILVGSHFSKDIPDAKLKPLFGWFVLIMGSIILVEQVIHL